MTTSLNLSQYITTRHGNTCCPPKERERCCVTEFRRQKQIEYVCYNAWLPNVRILTPYIPDGVLLDYIRRGVIEFATRTKVLTRIIELDLEKCVADYWPCLGEDERIDRVLQLAVNGECYEAVGHTCTWDLPAGHFWFHPPNSLEIHGLQKDCMQASLVVQAVPTETSENVDRLIHDRYFDAVMQYATAQASLIPPPADAEDVIKPNPSIYQERMRLFNIAVQRAKIDVARHFAVSKHEWELGHSGGCCG